MKGVDRGNYSQLNPYMDAPQGIGFGQTIREVNAKNSQPSTPLTHRVLMLFELKI